MKQQKQMIMTEGNPLYMIIRFSIPLVLSAFFQQLYSFVDSIIVGRCISVEALAAVNLTFSLNFVIMGITMGSAIGFCIPFAQSIGANDRTMISCYFWNGLYLSVALSLSASAITVPLTNKLLILINTPDNLMQMSTEYLQIMLLGMIATTVYNYLAGIMRALGDSRHPFQFLLISSGINFLLDLLLIVVFHMGVIGAAIATILSQVVSGILCAWFLFSKMGVLKVYGDDGIRYTKLNRFCIRRLCVIGLPMGLELSVNGVGSVLLQSCVNQLGSVAVAAVAAGEKIRSMITLPMENLGTAMSTYTAQNYGAKKYGRIRQGIRSSLVILIVYCSFAFLFTLIMKKPLVAMLLGTQTGETAETAITYLGISSILFVFHGTLQVFRNVLQGMGHSTAAIFSGGLEILGRILGGSLAVYYTSFYMICFSNPIAWLLAGAYCFTMILYFLHQRTEKKCTSSNS